MLTFLHLSDIHFIDRNHGTQFDIDQQIRRALLEDIAVKPADGAAYDAVLITGDIAYSGQQAEYKRAREFLSELFIRIGDLATNTFMVPGNHDVDRNFVAPDLPLWAAHARLRAATDPGVWRDHIYKQLVKDPLRSLLAPLRAYNDFAQGFGCFTGMVASTKPDEPDIPQIAWRHILEKKLDDGTLVQLHGLNSAIISDAGDEPGKLLLSSFQTAQMENQANVVNVVMCHHPPDWLMDKSEIRKALRSFAPVQLYGHEHETRFRPDPREVHLFAGAVQPSRRDSGDWIPTYHILQLAVRTTGNKRELIVRVYTREFTTDPPYRFRARRNERDSIFEEAYIELPQKQEPTTAAKISIATATTNKIASDPNVGTATLESHAPSPSETAQHELLVHFFQLATPLRYKTAFGADLLRDGDDTLDPQVMWAEVFRRATEENKLNDLWTAVAAHVPAIEHKPSPFAT